MKKPFGLTNAECVLWGSSVTVVAAAYALSGGEGMINGIASVIGVTALLFVAKGYVVGQLLVVAFSVLYGIISLYCRYYGEAITYLGMSTPTAIATAIVWWKNPYKGTREVKVAPMSRWKWIALFPTTAAVTALFYVILGALGNANLLLSTFSIATSFSAAYLTFFRSPYYAVLYASNDLVLIGLWGMMAKDEPRYFSMVACFVMFLVNDLYGFYQWRKMEKRQRT
ncbi:MAG: nicotinamide mononucleotide transporter [Clostridia bacterium]|nr:nicotinamide mononucleotide transporter [Clostridia bacterium]